MTGPIVRRFAAAVVALFSLTSAGTDIHLQLDPPSPSISIELLPGHAVPPRTAIDATVTLRNLDVNSYSSLILRADVTVSGSGVRICNGDDTGKDIEIDVDESTEIRTINVYDACPVRFYGTYILDVRIFDSGPDRIELASESTNFAMSRYLTPGIPVLPPPAPGTHAWMDPDPREEQIYADGIWHRFYFRTDVLLYINDHLNVNSSPGITMRSAGGYPGPIHQDSCNQPLTGYRRELHGQLWILGCQPGEVTIWPPTRHCGNCAALQLHIQYSPSPNQCSPSL